jgi:transposase
LEADRKKAVFFGSVPIYVYDIGDNEAESACIAMLSHTDLASDVAIAEAFGVHRNTVGRLARRLATEGMAAVVPAKRGPKGPHKVTSGVVEIIEAECTRMSAPALVDLIAERTGVQLSRSHVKRLARAHRPVQQELIGLDRSSDDEAEATGGELADPDASNDAPPGDDGGGWSAEEADDDLTLRSDAGLPAVLGEHSLLEGYDPPPAPPERTEGRYMGLSLYFPAISALGLVEVARQVFSLPRSILFGVRAVVLSVFFLTLLRKPTLESAKHLRRVEFGALMGTERASCVKTLRRKLDALVLQRRAAEFGRRLARRWVEQGVVASAYLYVDGHMKIYSGKHKLQQMWNSQRRMPLPGIQTYFVGDQDGRPLLFLTDDLSANLAKAMPRIIKEIRKVVGDRPFTVIFDRGGYDAGLFQWLTTEDVGFITYQKANPKLPDSAFTRREARFESRRVRFYLAEDSVTIKRTGPWRRMVLRTKDGHQTPVLTNLGPEIGSARICCLMFARWRQENLFKYLGAHHGLDQLVAYRFEPAEAQKLVPNPERKRLDCHIAEVRKQAKALKAALGDAVLDEPKWRGRSVHGLKVAQAGAVSDLRALQAKIDALVARRAELPKQVTVAESGTGREIPRREHKAIIERIKLSAYNAEEWLLDRLVHHYPHPEDVRDLLRSFAELSGEIRTTQDGITITLDPPDTPIHRRALRGLVADLNAAGATYPGTTIPVTYHVALHESEVNMHHFEVVA